MRVLTMIMSALVLFASVASAAPMPYDARQSLTRRDIVHQPRDTPQPPAVQAGTYVISSMASPDGEKLAITYNGQKTPLTLTPSSAGSPSQQWVIADEDGGQSVKPVNAPELEAAWGENGVTLLPPGGYVWTMEKTDNGYYIRDGKETAFWGIESAIDGAQVTIGAGEVKQTWLFEQV